MHKTVAREPTERLALELMRVIIAHLGPHEPLGRERVYEVLNALASTAGCVIVGTGGGAREAEWFFSLALHNQIAEEASGV